MSIRRSHTSVSKELGTGRTPGSIRSPPFFRRLIPHTHPHLPHSTHTFTSVLPCSFTPDTDPDSYIPQHEPLNVDEEELRDPSKYISHFFVPKSTRDFVLNYSSIRVFKGIYRTVLREDLGSLGASEGFLRGGLEGKSRLRRGTRGRTLVVGCRKRCGEWGHVKGRRVRSRLWSSET